MAQSAEKLRAVLPGAIAQDEKLELFFPDAEAIASAVYDLVCPGGTRWVVPKAVDLPELVQFKGPF